MRNKIMCLALAMAALACLLYPAASEGQEYEFVLSWPAEILGLRYPCGLAIDRAGNVYVADSGNGCIWKFDSEGNFLTKWGTWGVDDGQFMHLYGVAVDGT